MKSSLPNLTSVIIPALNEGKGIARTIYAVTDYFKTKNLACEIIVVDDGSIDDTRSVVEGLHLSHVHITSHASNRGKGASVRTGMLAAQGDCRLFIDADLQISVMELDKFWPKYREGADLIIAAAPNAVISGQPRGRGVLGFLAKRLIRCVMGWNIVDSQRGLKMIRGSLANDIFSALTVLRWGFDIEMLAIAKARGLDIREVPITYAAPIESRVSIGSYIYTLWELLRVWIQRILGFYNEDPLGRRLVLFAVIILVCLGVYFGQRFIFFDGDTVGVFYPDATTRGAKWASGILSGFPIPASFQWGFFHPIYRVISESYNALLVIFVFLAAYFSYLFARQLFSRRYVSLLVAGTFTLGQFTTHWLGNIAVLSAVYVLPVSLLMALSASRGAWGVALLYSVLIGLSFLGAHQQFVIMALIVAALYWVWLECDAHREGKSLRNSMKDGGRVIGVFVAALIIGLPQFLYMAVFTPLSTRIGGLTLAQASVDAATPLDLIKFILPHFSFRYGISGEFLPYIGIFGLIFALIGVTKMYKSESSVRFFTLLSVGAILTSFKYSPIFWLLHQFPVLEYFRGPARWTFVLNFAMAMLAGYGMKWTMEHWESGRASIQLYAGRLFNAMLGVAMTATLIFAVAGEGSIRFLQQLFTERMYQGTTGLPLEYYHALIERMVRSSFDNFSLGDASSMIALASIAVVYIVARYARDAQVFTGASVIASCALLGASGMMEHTFARSSVLSSSPHIADAILLRGDDAMSFRTFSFLYGAAGSQRVSAIHEGASRDAMMYGIDSLMPNTGLLRGIATIDGYEPMAPRRGQRVLAFVGSEVSQRYTSLANEDIPLGEKLSRFTLRLPVLSMLNVKYLISAYELPATPGLQLIEEVASTRFNIPIYLYENKTVMPRIYFARNVSFVSETDEEKNFKTIIESNTNFANTTFIECADCDSFKNRPTPSDSIAIDAYRDGYLRLTTKTSHDRWLVFSESNLPGWRITIDGRPVQSYMTNYLFHGLPVHGGEHVVEFTYDGVLKWEYIQSLF